MSITFSNQARRDLKGLEQLAGRRVVEAIKRYSHTGEGDVKRLKGNDKTLRLRVGSWRVLFVEHSGVLQVARVLHRVKRTVGGELLSCCRITRTTLLLPRIDPTCNFNRERTNELPRRVDSA